MEGGMMVISSHRTLSVNTYTDKHVMRYPPIDW
jgi:hypothetical protein